MPSFHRRLRDILVSSLASGGALGLAACGTSLDTSGLHSLSCEEQREPLAGVTSAVPADFVELRTKAGSEDGIRSSRGTLCTSAVDQPKCLADYEAVAFDGGERMLFGQAVDFDSPQLVVVTDEGGLHVFRTPEEVKRWLLPVDTQGDAVAVAELAGYSVACGDIEQGAVGERGDGYRVLATRITSSCSPLETTGYLLDIDPAGDVQEAESKVLESESGVCIGRRPEGLASWRSEAETACARWLAEVAYLEAASVQSFARLAAELTSFGAPVEFVAKARRAQADEVRHAARMGMLAERAGAELRAPAPVDFAARSLLSFACENAVEGCVLETFGALVGMHQASTAEDLRVREAMRFIARDEVRHGELAWEIDAWLRSELTAGEQREVDRARAEAAARLSEEPDRVDPALARRLGLPTGDVRRSMAKRFAAELSELGGLAGARRAA